VIEFFDFVAEITNLFLVQYLFVLDTCIFASNYLGKYLSIFHSKQVPILCLLIFFYLQN